MMSAKVGLQIPCLVVKIWTHAIVAVIARAFAASLFLCPLLLWLP